MPHFVVEYSGNLDETIDLKALATLIRDAAVDTGVFPLAGIRVRFHRCEIYEIADGAPEHGFVHIVLRMGAGRDLQTRKKAGTAIFNSLADFFHTELESGPFAISFEIVEIDAELNFKKNSIRKFLS